MRIVTHIGKPDPIDKLVPQVTQETVSCSVQANRFYFHLCYTGFASKLNPFDNDYLSEVRHYLAEPCYDAPTMTYCKAIHHDGTVIITEHKIGECPFCIYIKCPI